MKLRIETGKSIYGDFSHAYQVDEHNIVGIEWTGDSHNTKNRHHIWSRSKVTNTVRGRGRYALTQRVQLFHKLTGVQYGYNVDVITV